MKAIRCAKYGSPDVLRLKEVAKPTPKDDEVLIQVRAASINARDWRLMRANPFFIRLMFGFLRPKSQVLGTDLAGRVESVGRNVKQFQIRDEVFGCLFGDNRSTFAEYVCAKENEIILKPANLSFEQAAAVPLAALTALQGLQDKGNIQPGQKVLIQGASGGVGTFAVQIAKAFGAEVTAVCSARNLDMVRSIGADHVIDYTREDFTHNGQTYDVILDMVPGKSSFARYQSSLKPNGLYLAGAGGLEAFAQMAWTALAGGKKVMAGVAPDRVEDLVFLKELLESGKLKPVIDRCYPLEQAAEAHRYADTGHKRGSVVITITAEG